MAIYRSLNKTSNTGNAVPWYIKETLKDAGWTVPFSGTGYSGSYDTSDLFTSFAPGSSVASNTILGRARCWFVIEAPNGRQMLYWRSNSAGTDYDGAWMIAYSAGGLYTGGNTDTAATATDESILFGLRPPTTSQIFQNTLGNNLVHVVADSVNLNGEYSFRAIEFKPTNTCSAFIWWDTLLQPAVGDGCPLIVGCINGAIGVGTLANESGTRAMKVTADVGGGGEALVNAAYGYARAWSRAHYLNGQFSLYDGNERPLPYPVYGAGNAGTLGISGGIQQAAVARDYPALDVASSMHLYVSQVVLPDFWDGSTTPYTV